MPRKKLFMLWYSIVHNQSLMIEQHLEYLHSNGSNPLDIIEDLRRSYKMFLVIYSRDKAGKKPAFLAQSHLKLEETLYSLRDQIQSSYYPERLLSFKLVTLSKYLSSGSQKKIAKDLKEHVLDYIWNQIICNSHTAKIQYLFLKGARIISINTQKIILVIESITVVKLIWGQVSSIKKELNEVFQSKAGLQIKLENIPIGTSGLTERKSIISTQFHQFEAFSNFNKDYLKLYYLTQLLSDYYINLY